VIDGFWSGLTGKLAERWTAILLSPAFAFWAFGLGAWLLSRPDAAARQRLVDGFTGLSGPAQISVLILALLVVAASSVVADRQALPVLRWLEGYWPRPLRPLARALAGHRRARQKRLEQRWNELYARHQEGTADADSERELIEAELHLSELPARPERVMPTRLGNILRARESGIVDKYGIDPVRCWPALWLVLPDSTKQVVGAERASLDTAVTWWVWAVLVAVWTLFTPWALLVAAAAAWPTYVNVRNTAARYGELIDAAFAVHRGLLYDALGRPRPAPANEHASGQALTTALWRGPAEGGIERPPGLSAPSNADQAREVLQSGGPMQDAHSKI
jgi:hypothetical protein